MIDQKKQTTVIEFVLSGQKLTEDPNNVDKVNAVGSQLYEKNKDFIKDKVKDNWYGIIDPTTGVFISSSDPMQLYEYSQKNHPNKLFYFVGLLRNYYISYYDSVE